MKNLNELNYCPHCQKYVERIRKPFEDNIVIIWTIVLIVTLGLASPILIYLYFRRKKQHCKECKNIVIIIPPGSDLTEVAQLPKEMYSVPSENPSKEAETLKVEIPITSKAEKAAPPKDAVIFYRKIQFCPFCGEKLGDKSVEFCPGCGADLNEGD